MRRFLLEPMDYALFRDARPFSPDELSLARSAGPIPLPRTVYGMLRALLIQERSIDPGSIGTNLLEGEFGAVLGTVKRVGTLSIRGPFLGATEHVTGAGEMFLPSPADVIAVREEGAWTSAYLRPSLAGGIGNGPTGLVPLAAAQRRDGTWIPADDDKEIGYEPGDRFLKTVDRNLENYLTSQTPPTSEIEAFRSERHIGLERGGDFKAVEGMLYGVEFVRPGFRDKRADKEDDRSKSFHYVVEIDIGDRFFPAESVFTLGGERRPFRIAELDGVSPLDDASIRESVERHLINSISDGVCRFRLYLLTPALFRRTRAAQEIGPLCADGTFDAEGWLPDFLNLSDLQGTKENVSCTLKAAAVTRAFPVSGWNMDKKRPRDGWLAVPAGAVYFLEASALDGADGATLVRRILDRFWLQSICNEPEDKSMGFGCVLVGGYEYV
jgi:CRISPR type III-B/RAMP module-associated protein Cmr3